MAAEILARYKDGIIALVDIEQLHDHEQIRQDYLSQLAEEIKKDKELRYPIIVDKYSNVVLDGHHRYFALKKLGCFRVPAYIVDYYNPKIKVGRWHPVVKTKREVKAIFKCLSSSGFIIEKVEDEKIAEVLVESGQASMGMVVHDDSEDYFIAKNETKNYNDAMSCIRNGLATEELRHNLDYIGDESEVEILLKSRQASMAIITPTITKEKIIETGMKGDPFPPKTTRHVLPQKRLYPVSLTTLMKPNKTI